MCHHSEQAQRRQPHPQSRSWEAAQHQADAEIEGEEAEIVHEQLVEDLQRRNKAAANCDHGGSEDEEELTFGAYRTVYVFPASKSEEGQKLICKTVYAILTEEYVEVAQLAAVEEGGEDCEDELDRELLRQMFDEVDVDCSGTVTLSELSAHRLRAEDRVRNKQREAFHQV